MPSIFVLLGIAVACYVVWAVASGSIVARSGIRMRSIRRDESPHYFWFVACCYLLLALALIFVF